MPITGQRWSEAERDFIRENYPRLRLGEIANALDRSVNAVNAQRFYIGIPSQPRHRNFRHGHASSTNRLASREHRAWESMLQRCRNPRDKGYPNYGGRGIRVCHRWLVFENFLADMGQAPEGLTLERVDNFGDYEPSNCKWASAVEQANNRRNNQVLVSNGEALTISQWSARLNLPRGRISQRLKAGWSINDALTIPVGGRR